MMRHKKDNISVATPEDVAHYAPDAGDAVAQAPSPETPAATADQPVETLESLRAERDQLKDKLLRAQAECANISKRLHQQQGEALKLAGMQLARELLPIVDNFERSLTGLQTDPGGESLVAGIKLIADQLAKVLRDHGVESIEAVGKPFDPTYHEALMSDPTSNLPPGTITSELQRGYTMHGRVLRPARVTVAAEPSEPASES